MLCNYCLEIHHAYATPNIRWVLPSQLTLIGIDRMFMLTLDTVKKSCFAECFKFYALTLIWFWFISALVWWCAACHLSEHQAFLPNRVCSVLLGNAAEPRTNARECNGLRKYLLKCRSQKVAIRGELPHPPSLPLLSSHAGARMHKFTQVHLEEYRSSYSALPVSGLPQRIMIWILIRPY